MHYSNTTTMRSRAGLVALIFALIISLVSAVPIPTAESGLSSSTTFSPNNINPSPKGQPEVDAASLKIPISDRMSTLPGALSPRDISNDMDDQLVRRGLGAKIRADLKKAGQAIAHVAKKVVDKVASGVKSVVNKAVTGIKTVAKKVETGVKTAAKKVENFVKTTGATVAKFGLKVYQSVGEVVGHVASYIPAIGKPVQQAIHAATAIAGFASDHIHAKLSPKLQKGMNIMNKADKIMSYLPRDLGSEEEEAFQQRNIFSDAYSSFFASDRIHTTISVKLQKGMNVMNKPNKVTSYTPRDLVSEEEEAFQQRDILSDAYSSYLQERDDVEFLENREDSYLEAYERDIYELYDDMD